MVYKGGCHCGKIAFEVEGDIQGNNPKTNETTAAINVRCLEDVDVSKLNLTHFDGRSL